MRPLIVPVNFSECAFCAARYAADLAMTIDGELHLINVINLLPSTEQAMTEYVYEDMLKSANIYIQSMQQELQERTHNKVPIHITVSAGSVTGQVEELCKKINPYAIVLGASGPTFEKLVTGSPVGALLRLPYPVLVVPEKGAFHSFQHIVLACGTDDLESGLPHSFALIQELRNRFKARVDVVTIENWKVLGGEEASLRSGVWLTQLKELNPQIHFVHKKNIEEGLISYLSDHPADLVIVFPKKHHPLEFHRSQSKKIAKHSAIPVMCLHE